MNSKKLLEHLPTLLLDDEQDAEFMAIRVNTQGMSGVRTAKLINFAARCMDKGEYYVEIGTYSGFTLISAIWQNNSMAIGIDDFSFDDIVRPEKLDAMKSAVSQMLDRNLSAVASQNATVLKSDFRAVELSAEAKGKLAVLFIDGKHTYTDVMDSLRWAGDYLAKDAFIILDDTNVLGVYKAVCEIMQTPGYQLHFLCNAVLDDHEMANHRCLRLDQRIAGGIAVFQRTI